MTDIYHGNIILHGLWSEYYTINDTFDIIQLIGLREKLQENPMIFMGKSMVSG